MNKSFLLVIHFEVMNLGAALCLLIFLLSFRETGLGRQFCNTLTDLVVLHVVDETLKAKFKLQAVQYAIHNTLDMYNT